MALCMRTGVVLFLLIQVLVGCGRFEWRPTPLAPSTPLTVQQPVIPNQLIVFRDPLTGLSTSDVRDAQDHIVQFMTAGELVWTADGTHLPVDRVQQEWLPEGRTGRSSDSRRHAIRRPTDSTLTSMSARKRIRLTLVFRSGRHPNSRASGQIGRAHV